MIKSASPDNKLKIILYTGAAAAFLLFIVVIGVKYSPWIISLAQEPENFRSLLLSHGRAGIFIYILFQMAQAVIATIPGEPVQIAGGYIYGIAAGTVYSLIGIIFGYMIVFLIVRAVGYPLVKIAVPENKIRKMQKYFLSPKADAVIFILFLIPGLPKDFFVYIIGLTPVSPFRFFVLVTIARFPAMVGASYIGANIMQENYPAVVVASMISLLLFLAGFFYKEKILHALEERLPQKESGDKNIRKQ
jgi:uncharacterized membrane protein YdjX (TVP38/TMEM64 family)